jgi:hypothetical protein
VSTRVKSLKRNNQKKKKKRKIVFCKTRAKQKRKKKAGRDILYDINDKKKKRGTGYKQGTNRQGLERSTKNTGRSSNDEDDRARRGNQEGGEDGDTEYDNAKSK